MRSKKELTPEQKKQAEENKAKIKQICATIKAMSPEDQQTFAAKSFIATVEGRMLSVHNQIMAATQNPNATIVGGFWQWKENGRQIMKGSKCIKIWAPVTNGGGEEELQPPAEEGKEKSRLRFVLVSVFDVSQTEAIGATKAA